MSYQPDPAILELGEGFFDEVTPAAFPKLVPRFRNQEWAERVGLGHLSSEEWQRHFGEFSGLPGNLERPLALRYHGHQFQQYNPDLGDGRGFLFAQFRDPKDERLLDLGTKGSGQTPYSRRGDGRLTLKGAVREALATEMLESLGVYTSKTFSIFETGEALERHDEPSPTRAAVLVRLSHSHIRFGTFQRLAFERDVERTNKLIDYCIRHFYPTLEALPRDAKASALVKEVALKAADLCASWMTAGFVHGVLNTDNMNITGESFDYGPYRFLPKYDPEFTAAYFDQTGLYAYGRQPEVVLWNLEQLATCFLMLGASRESLTEALQAFAPRFNETIVAKLLGRLGLKSLGHESDDELFILALNFLATSQVTFPQFFHDWYGGAASQTRALKSPESTLYKGEHFAPFLALLAKYEPTAGVERALAHSYFSQGRPCSLLIEEIEWIWESIAKDDDWQRFKEKIEDIREMGQVYGSRKI